ncbi:hypothetical protein [Chengkuizengella marina]|nr:hypothetical protein [Chengkuizengella marina]
MKKTRVIKSLFFVAFLVSSVTAPNEVFEILSLSSGFDPGW